MNGKQARKLRKVARVLSAKLNIKWTDYLVKHRTKTMYLTTAKGKKAVDMPVTRVTLIPNCGRKLYRHMKKDFNQQSQATKAKMTHSDVGVLTP